MSDLPRLGRKIKALRRRVNVSQAALAERLGISASYLNLIESDRRRLPASLLLKLAQLYDLDLREFAAGDDVALLADLDEALGDPLFEHASIPPDERRELVAASPELARTFVRLFHAYQSSRALAHDLAEQMSDPQQGGIDRVRVSSEQVSDFIQRHGNHFPELEEAAERIWHEAHLDEEDLFAGLAGYLEERHGVRVEVVKVGAMGGALRRFDQDGRALRLSEVLRRGSRHFQLAHQVGLLSLPDLLDRLAADPQLTTEESRALGRVALANYFAAALLMPYEKFLSAARDVRYDVDLLGHRFRASFEQVCHRLTTLRRKGAEGVPFHMIRIDIAGNISKKFSATGIRFPRFSGLCPLWNVHAAFLQPGFIRAQIARFPDGTTFFSIARTVRRHRGGYQAQNVLNAISIGCGIEFARELVYSDGIDLQNSAAAVPVGVTCRLCERMDCEARAFPPLQGALRIDENVRGVSFFAPLRE